MGRARTEGLRPHPAGRGHDGGEPGGGNRFLIVDRDGDHYVQVWRFDGGGYELEYRDGGPHSHHRAFSDSSVEVATAMSGWLTAARDWREPLTWEDISHRFTGDAG
ncbi:hypothetical protein SAMN05421803_10161 [Nocardiopsis flavescens]|uniref:Uncharacterized protein n=1 Tax=Nocardiopsis flavescens TaxID=758803 RepID=A0A1M6APW2_9ACTN|nr:hypothetical protein [Nocardiopsis flavescens]SHI38243.1 hypothetical protein SAMN05421803_10161 [Nocardiopsis flavescens]